MTITRNNAELTHAPELFARSLAPSLLSPDERTTLLWVCGALFPRLEATGGDDAELFTADAISLGVPGAIEEALAAVPQEQVQDFRLLLRALDHPLFVLGIIGKAKSFRSLRAEDRERVLLAMATSSVPLARKGFQAVKRLASFLFYALDGRAAHQSDLARHRLRRRAHHAGA